MAERSILVVDDEKMIHTVIKAGLAKHGYHVHSAFDSVQALMLARQLKPDLIILDITMPGGGGVEAFKRLQMITTTSTIPILVYTSMPAAEVAKKIPAGPGVEILIKTAAPEELLAAVQRLLGEG
jgi:CheY-like chemotaxis protein